MSLRKKTILIIGLSLVCLLAILVLSTKDLFLHNFERLEEVDTRQSIHRVETALDNELLELNMHVGDWAPWTDTYLFVQDHNPTYEQENLNLASLENLGLDVLLIVDNQNLIVAGRSFNPWTGIREPVPAGMLPHLAAGMPLVTHTRLDSSVSGIVMVDNRPLMVAAQPILTSSGEGPIQGTLIMGRFMDDRVLHRVADSTLLQPIVMTNVKAKDDPDYAAALAQITPEDPFYIKPVDPRAITGMVQLYDLYGKPAVLVCVDQPRAIFLQGQAMFSSLVVAILVFGCVFILVSLTLLDRQVLSRLAKLSHEVTQIGDNSDGWHQVTVDGRDEVARLADTINVMLNHLGQSRTALKKAHVELEQRVDERTAELARANRNLQVEVVERRRAEAALAASEERYALATRGSNDGIWDLDLTTNRVYYSSRWKDMLGYADEEIGDSIDEWYNRVHPDDLHRLQSDMHLHLTGFIPQFESEHRILDKDGEYRWVRARGLAVWDEEGEATRIAGSLTDTSGQKQVEEQLKHDAMYDLLTKLSNRTYFIAQLKRAVDHVRRRSGFLAAVLLMDLDRFKLINDSLGHHVGDQLLVAIARRLETCLRPDDTISRLGGDEFGILLEDIHQVSDAIRVARRIQDALNTPFIIDGNEVFTTASIGIALTNAGYTHPEEMLRDADTAMYRAKANGKARHEIFDKAMHAESISQLQIEADLRRALERKEFVVFYQPLVSLADGRITRAEALVRWEHPYRGWISPRDFIGTAEETGLIVPLGAWVLETACRQVKAWHDAGFTSMGISVNIAAAQLEVPHFDRTVAQILEETGLPPESLELEITESTAMQDVEYTSKVLRALRDLGVGISIDDFGISYSSLGYLKHFPVTALKIDRSFVADIDEDPHTAAIVKAILAMGSVLNLRMVAEGVELTSQLDWLARQECDEAQGFLFSRAVPAEEFTALMEKTEGIFQTA